MKKGVYILLLVFIGLHICGYYPIFKLLQYRIRQEVKAGLEKDIPESKLHFVSISDENPNEIKWVRPGKEFRYKGNMYDIVTIKKEKGITHYICVSDRDETRLSAYLDEMVKKQIENDNNPSGNSAKKILKVLRLNYVASQKLLINIHSTGSVIYANYSSSISAPFLNHTTPPPKQIT
ncbi:MAG: hypothetical protein JNL63_00530 [Bacteroidia bacterium]|nr:hypothetical protein [Bacteroidia bacterium]